MDNIYKLDVKCLYIYCCLFRSEIVVKLSLSLLSTAKSAANMKKILMSATLVTIAIIVQQTIATYSLNRPAVRSSRISRDEAANEPSNPNFYVFAWLAPSGSVFTRLDCTMQIPSLPLNTNTGVSSHFKYFSLLG